jgi:four helix bundle protein
MPRPRRTRVIVRQLSAQVERDVRRLTDGTALDGHGRLRAQLADAVEALSRNVAHALEADRDVDVARHIRLARASLTAVRDGLQTALIRKCVSDPELRDLREVLGRLYPALNSLLVLTVNFRSGTSVP